jgi:penicillin amidase
MLRWVLLGIAAVVLLALGTGYGLLRASLPQLEGSHSLAGLTAAVRIERDAAGVPRVIGNSRLDVARASGFLHAQERYFQMDLLRRRAAGELAALLGAPLFDIDAQARRFHFREVARQVLQAQNPAQQALLQAYVDGVNAGLTALAARPWEYQLLRVAPEPWLPEDSLLCVYSMWLDLQDYDANIDRSLRALRLATGEPGFEFIGGLAQRGDATLDDSALPDPPLPAALPAAPAVLAQAMSLEPPFVAGSNSFAIAAAHSANGLPVLANDMHLGLRVPHIWYRATLQWSDTAGALRQVSGVMLPGMPAMVVGSNSHVAWGFTNSNIDTVDAVPLGPQDAVHERIEQIRIRGAATRQLRLRESALGPVLTDAAAPQQLALRWTALQPHATNLQMVELEDSLNVAQALQVAHRSGMPNQNILVVDDSGHTAWSLTGAIPLQGADGWLPAERVPTRLDPPEGLLWTANNRVVGGAALALLGDGGYDGSQRAASIRDDLRARAAQGALTERDLLAVQLGDRAVHLEPWRQLLLTVLDDAFVADQPARGALREAVQAWQGHASVDSVGYRAIRAFRTQASQRALGPWVRATQAVYPQANLGRLRPEVAALRLLQNQPAALLDPAFASWQVLLQQAADAVVKDAGGTPESIREWTWGQYNVLAMRHPLSAALPKGVGRWLDMPAEAQPGDSDMARVARPTSGASERMVVSPGHEQQGLLHMPGGQSGHPLSPYYRAGHEAWAKGEPAPLLPGDTRWNLTLQP